MAFTLTKEQEAFRSELRKFAEEQLRPRAKEFVEGSEKFPPELLKVLKQKELFKYFFPKEYGGVGVSSVNICLIREELSRVNTTAESVPVMNGLGANPIVLFGTDEQKRKYIPSLSKAESFASFCLTEPAAGSDVASLEATARLEGDNYILNGVKTYVSHPDLCNLFIVFAKTAPELKSKGISGFIVEKKFGGITFEKMRFIAARPVGKIILENCKVPKENLLGPLNSGMRVALSNLNVYRTTVGAHAIGMAQGAYEEALAYAKERKAFGRNLAEFQAIQFKLADMATLLEASRLMVYRAASLRDEGAEVIKEASMAKLFATESAQKIVDEAVQIFGGRGIWEDSRVAFLYKAVRLPRVYEGTSEIQRVVIARQLLGK
ncbi:MAG: acyl-CoA dehydrogenase family protein [Chloroflexota bacterium]